MSKLLRASVLSAAALLYTGSGALAEESYGKTIGLKAGSGFSTSFRIVGSPKNIIKTSNDYNLLLGVAGGTVKEPPRLGQNDVRLVDVVTSPCRRNPSPPRRSSGKIGIRKPSTGPSFPPRTWFRRPLHRHVLPGRKY